MASNTGEGDGGTGLLGAIAAIGAFLGSLFGLFSDDTKWIRQAFINLAEVLDNAFRVLGDTIGLLAAGDVMGAIKRVKDAATAAAKKIADAAAAVVPYLKRIRDWLDWAFNKIIRPLLQLISVIRKWLIVFKLMHLKFADTLDKWLAQAQVELTRPFLLIRGQLNAMLSVLELLVNPLGILLAAPLLWGIIQNLGSLDGIMHLGGMFGSKLPNSAERIYWRNGQTLANQRALGAMNSKGIMDANQQALKAQVDKALHG